jgi:hypothetical protein
MTARAEWLQKLEQHLKAELADKSHPRYARAADGRIRCPTCGDLSFPPAREHATGGGMTNVEKEA